MAINLDERYPGRANPKTLDYPQGSFKNRTSPSAKDGTYLEQDWANDMLAFFQSMLQEAGITANGQVDTAQASQYYDALLQNIRGASIPFYATTPGSNVGPIIYVIDRQQILLWQTIGSFTGYASAEVGDFRWGTSIAAKPGTELIIGQTVDRTLPKYAALIAWAEANGHMKTSGAWVKGAFHFAGLSGNNVRLPDLRDQFIRATGTDLDTANARELGSSQLDALQNFTGAVNFRKTSAGPAFLGVGGAFYDGGDVTGAQSITGTTDVMSAQALRFDASRAVRTSSESRGINTALHPLIAL